MLLKMNLTGPAWRRLFADTLIRLRPDLNPDAVDELSDAAWLRWPDLPPAEAAALTSSTGRVPDRPPQDQVEPLAS